MHATETIRHAMYQASRANDDAVQYSEAASIEVRHAGREG